MSLVNSRFGLTQVPWKIDLLVHIYIYTYISSSPDHKVEVLEQNDFLPYLAGCLADGVVHFKVPHPSLRGRPDKPRGNSFKTGPTTVSLPRCLLELYPGCLSGVIWKVTTLKGNHDT